LELQLDQVSSPELADPDQLLRLDHVASLLADCRSLLEEPAAFVNPHEDEALAA
jgi:hypothetical protein